MLREPNQRVEVQAGAGTVTGGWGAVRQAAAQVVLADGTLVDGRLHLLCRPSAHAGFESPLEMLNREAPFFALTRPGGGVLFVAKAQAAIVSCPHEEPLDTLERLPAARLVALDVVLAGGRGVRGWAPAELPPGRARSLDYVNGPGAFFALWTDDLAHCINKSLVRAIRPLD